ncbi:MAG: phage portal protein [Candidatus Peribacteraceae bacterium]|nr:phage portal protein [Candidatus Peribacteraceae bacterium]
MPNVDIGGAVASDLKTATTDYSVDPRSTDSAGDQKEYTWQSTKWAQWLGYYTVIPELKIAIDTKANWTLGAGFEADETTLMLLGNIKGNGKDSFNSILKNMIRTYTIGGDSFAEVIRDEDGVLINLKPLDPASMVIVQSNKGRIIRYEQTTKMKTDKKKYNPEKIFHLSRDRIADEIHGISVVEAVEWIIKARNEVMSDMKKLMHYHVIPRMIYELDTDDETEISEFKAKEDAANAAGENIYIPMNAVKTELLSVPPNATLSPLAWIDKLNDYFFQAVNVPQIIIGNAKEFTDASGKIVYLSYEQSVKGEQLYIEEQILGQLNLWIQLTFPATLQNEMISSREKESDMQASQPSDTTANIEGKK